MSQRSSVQAPIPEPDPRFDAPTIPGNAGMNAPVQGARRIVVKVGSSLVTNEGRGVDPRPSATGAANWPCWPAQGARW
jgi:hypothetical protein